MKGIQLVKSDRQIIVTSIGELRDVLEYVIFKKKDWRKEGLQELGQHLGKGWKTIKLCVGPRNALKYFNPTGARLEVHTGASLGGRGHFGAFVVIRNKQIIHQEIGQMPHEIDSPTPGEGLTVLSAMRWLRKEAGTETAIVRNDNHAVVIKLQENRPWGVFAYLWKKAIEEKNLSKGRVWIQSFGRDGSRARLLIPPRDPVGNWAVDLVQSAHVCDPVQATEAGEGEW